MSLRPSSKSTDASATSSLVGSASALVATNNGIVIVTSAVCAALRAREPTILDHPPQPPPPPQPDPHPPPPPQLDEEQELDDEHELDEDESPLVPDPKNDDVAAWASAGHMAATTGIATRPAVAPARAQSIGL
jgi:hypothetical protein